MWLILFVVIFILLFGVIIYYSLSSDDELHSHEGILCDAFIASGRLTFPKKDLRQYFQLRDEVAPQDSPLEEFRLRLRASNPELVSEMRKSLLRSAMAVQENYSRISSEYMGNMQLYKKLLLSEKQWCYVEGAMEELKETVEYIRDEASLIQDNWGEYIFLDAKKLNLIRKRQEELRMLKEKKAREREIEEKKAREKEVNDSQMANKIAMELLNEFDSKGGSKQGNNASLKKRK